MCKWSNNRGYCFPDPGEAQDINCGICAEKMNVKRGIFGPTGFIEAMSPRGGHWHDYFECPNLGELWHKHIVSLTDEQMKTNSAKIKQILDYVFRNLDAIGKPVYKNLATGSLVNEKN